MDRALFPQWIYIIINNVVTACVDAQVMNYNVSPFAYTWMLNRAPTILLQK